MRLYIIRADNGQGMLTRCRDVPLARLIARRRIPRRGDAPMARLYNPADNFYECNSTAVETHNMRLYHVSRIR